MKIFCLIAASIVITSATWSREMEEPTGLNTMQDVHEYSVTPDPFSSISNVYFKFGTSVLYQGVGIGLRSRNFLTHTGHDIGCNFKMFPFITSKGGFASLEYARLFYKKSDKSSDDYKYSGVGLEVGTFVGNKGYLFPIPNPKVVWGKQYSSGRFSQWSLNVTPMVFVPVVSMLGDAVTICAISSLVFEYSIGF